MKVLLARVDDRLIHGQVMTAWLGFTGAKRIVIVDDATAEDQFTRTIIAMAVPKNIKLDVFGIADAVECLKADTTDEGVILLAKFPDAFLQLVESGCNLEEVVIGGMGVNKNRTKLYKNIAASENEREVLKKMIEHGINVKIQIIPDQKSVTVKELL